MTDERRDEPREGLPAGWAECAEAARLRELVGDGATTRAWSGAREARLIAGVLRRTTREDLSWRGEVRLFSEFVRDRVAGSPALKLLAASLLAHVMLGGPLLAWWAYRAVVRERQPLITFELPAEELATTAAEDLSVEPLAPTEPEELFAQRVDNAVRRARFGLTRGGFRVVRGPACVEMRLLALRSSGLSERAWSDLPSDPPNDLSEGPGDSRLAAVLAAERRLDQWLLTKARPPETTAALVAVSEVLASAEAGSALKALAARVLTRAQAYGGWPAPPGFDPRSAPLPLDAEWVGTLERAFSEAGLGGLEVELTPLD